MSKQEKMAGAMRLFEALSGVDEELLARCEEKAKVRPIWYYGKVLAACLCFVVMGALLWRVNPMLKTSMNSSGSMDMAPAAVEDAPAMAVEEAAVENETALESVVEGSNTTAEQDNGTYGSTESGTGDGSLKDTVTESPVENTGAINQESAKSEAAMQEAISNTQQSAMQDLKGSKESMPTDVTEGTPLDNRKELALEDAKAVVVLGEYVPTAVPAGYAFEGAWLTENSSTGEAEKVTLCWVNGMDDIHIIISYATEDVATVDVTQTEAYDVHRYEIPYGSTVPQEYRTVFNNPIFAAEDFSREIVKMRMKVVADAGDTDTPRGNFAVLYKDGVLVEFNGDGDAESIYEMMESVR